MTEGRMAEVGEVLDATSPDDDHLVLRQEEGRALGGQVRQVLGVETFMMQVIHTVRRVTRIANGRVLMNVDGDAVDCYIEFTKDRYQGRCSLRYLPDLPTLRERLTMALHNATLSPWWRSDRLVTESFGPQSISTSDIWKPATAAALREGTARESALTPVFDVLDASTLIGAGFLSFVASARYVLHGGGLEAYGRETDSQLSVRAIARDGTSSGWAGRVARDWSTVVPAQVAREAVDVAERGAHPVALEPGRRTVILSATAFGQLLDTFPGAFDARNAESGIGVLSDGRKSRIGKRVMDARLRMWSDPNDPMGGNMPFFGDPRDGAQRDFIAGFPVTPVSLIEGGVLRNLVYGMGYGTSVGKPFNRWPFALHVAPMPDVATQTLDEMIAHCPEGIYVNRFGSLLVTDAMRGQVTGVTRDGCFYIKDGKIVKPIKNLRFLTSPMFVLNQLLAIGVPMRVQGADSLWPETSFPVIAPPVMVSDFNFIALCDAV